MLIPRDPCWSVGTLTLAALIEAGIVGTSVVSVGLMACDALLGIL